MFKCHRYDKSRFAYQYICGLLQARRRNIERIEESVPNTEYQSLQQFISDSPWDERRVIDKVAQDVDQLIGGTASSALLLDESAFAKKGNRSAGVARQWNGRLGKRENSQVGVFAALCAGDRVAPIDVRLYLPEEWANNRQRCLSAKIPECRIEFKTKIELALEMIKHQRSLGTRFNWVGADSLYGNSWHFCRTLEEMEEFFVVDVPKDRKIFLEDPNPSIPPRRSRFGPAPSRPKPQADSIRLDQYSRQLDSTAWQRLSLRDGTKGPVEVEIHHRLVWLFDDETNTTFRWHLIIRRDCQTGEIKWSISNANENASTEDLAKRQGQRYWIERCFEDSKGEAGMADYQVRGWVGWHHHMTLVMIAMLFMLRQRMLHKEHYPLLSCRDVRTLLGHFLPCRDVTSEEVFRQMNIRHRKRQAAIDSAYRQKARAPTLC